MSAAAKGQEALEKAKKQYDEEKKKAQDTLDKMVKKEKERLEKELPLPPEPKKPDFILEEEKKQAEAAEKAKRIAQNKKKGSITEAMELNTPYTAAEVGELFGESAAWALPKLNALIKVGLVSKIVENRVAYFFRN